MSNTEETKEIAAAKAGMDVKTARKYLRARRLPSELKAERQWLTRPDGFVDVWPEIASQLSTNPGLEAKTIFAALQRQYPERFADGQLRTLQRRIKRWRASEGPVECPACFVPVGKRELDKESVWDEARNTSLSKW